MRTRLLPKVAAITAVAMLAGAWSIGQAVVPPDLATPPITAGSSAPNLPFGVPQILKLAQGKVSDTTIIAYIQNTGDSYNLSADQILWLRSQGVSDAVLTAMLSQPRAGVASSPSAPPAPQPLAAPAYPNSYPAAAASAYPAPDPAPTVDASDYSPPVYYSQPYYYSGYTCPPVIYYNGWSGYARGYHGYRSYGGYYGGYRGGRIGTSTGFRSGGGGFRGGVHSSGGFRGGAGGRGGISHH